jgi:hypothetical protein
MSAMDWALATARTARIEKVYFMVGDEIGKRVWWV